MENYSLVNFNMPNYLKNNFDELLKFKRVSRTSIMNALIEGYCRQEYRKLEQDDKLNHLILDIKRRNRKSRIANVEDPETPDDQYYPPEIPDFEDDWEKQLMKL